MLPCFVLLGFVALAFASPATTWVKHAGFNCYHGHGATDIDHESIGQMTLEACEAKCDQVPECIGITRGFETNAVCFRRKDIVIGQCVPAPDFDTYTKGSSPAPTPPPGVPGEYGCGVAMSGDWPSCGRQFDTTYAFDFAAVMNSAELAAGRPVWRYDWRSTEHPRSGNWNYIAMDWCPRGGKNEHPDPAGPSPGLLGWNEPNAAQQCNTAFSSVQEFVSLAKQFKARGKFVVSPAPTHDAAWSWLDGMLGTMHDHTDQESHFLDVDYLAYHHYVSCNGATTADDIFGQLESVLLNFKAIMDKWNARGMHIKGLWLTEVSCGWVNGRWTGNCGDTCDRNTMLSLMKLVRKYSVLKTWSWFAYNNFGNLWVNDKARNYPLTELGQIYFANCNPALSNGSSLMVV